MANRFSIAVRNTLGAAISDARKRRVSLLTMVILHGDGQLNAAASDDACSKSSGCSPGLMDAVSPSSLTLDPCGESQPQVPIVGNTVEHSTLDGPVRRLYDLSRMTNDDVIAEVRSLKSQVDLKEAELLLYLGEMDFRKLYRIHASPSLFDYCVSRLGLSEDMAYKRIAAARLIRVFPAIHTFLSAGRVHLSTLLVLKPHLTSENHRDWLAAAAGKSKREVEQFVARRRPLPDVPAQMRKLPDRPSRQASELQAGVPCNLEDAQIPPAACLESTPRMPRTKDIVQSTKPSHDQRSTPLSASSYRVTFTATQRLKDKLDRAGQLVSHTVSPKDLPGLVEMAMDMLIAQTERKRFGSNHVERENRVSPSADPHIRSPDTRSTKRSRHIPASVRRAVWDRDGGQCTFVDDDGNRCPAKHFIQFDHQEPHAFGGAPSLSNLRLRCAQHNALAAEEVFGRSDARHRRSR